MDQINEKYNLPSSTSYNHDQSCRNIQQEIAAIIRNPAPEGTTFQQKPQLQNYTHSQK